MSTSEPRLVYLTTSEINALNACKKFFVSNDALPTALSLSKIITVKKDTAERYLRSLQKKEILLTNKQGGLRWTRKPYTIEEIPNLPQQRKIISENS